MDLQFSLQECLLKEIIDCILQWEVFVFYSKNGFCYCQVYELGCEYVIYQWQLVLKEEWDEWEILFDVNQWVVKSEFYILGGLGIVFNNQLMVVVEDYFFCCQYGLCFCDFSNGEWYLEIFENVIFGFVWSNDLCFVWYVCKYFIMLFFYQVWCYIVGILVQSDVLVYEEKDEIFYVSVYKIIFQQFVVIYFFSVIISEVLLFNVELLDVELVCFLLWCKDYEYSFDYYQYVFYFCFNWEGKNFGFYCIVLCDEEQWIMLILLCYDVMFEGFILFIDWLVVEECQCGLISLW